MSQALAAAGAVPVARKPPVQSRELRGRAAPAERRQSLAVPLILLYAILLPAGMNFSIGSLLFMPYRVALVALLPAIAMKWQSAKMKPGLADYLVFAGAGYFFIAMINHKGFIEGIESGGSLSLDLVASYLVGRLYFRSTMDFSRFLKLALPIFMFVAAIYAAESITHQKIIAEWLPLDRVGTTEIRMGLLRAQGPFPHPILGGLFFASLFAFYWFGMREAWVRWCGAVTACAAIFSLSSAGIISLALAIMLCGYATISKRATGRIDWRPIGFSALAGLFGLELLAGGGAVRFIIRNATLDPTSGYFRLQIWNWGSRSVAEHPLFGVGFSAYERAFWMVTDSIDDYWLLLAVRFGLPSAVALCVSVLVAIFITNRARRSVQGHANDVLAALVVTLITFWLMLWTVAIWDNVLSWFYFVLGAAVGLAANLAGAPILAHAGKRGARRPGAAPRSVTLGPARPRRARPAGLPRASRI